MIKTLDEAGEYVDRNTFNYISAVDLSLHMDSFQWGFRNFQIPLI
jgi:hypothetical protein